MTISREERRLYRAIVLQALRDYVRDPSNILDTEKRLEVEQAQADSRQFFLTLGRASDLMTLCELGGIDYGAVVSTISRVRPSELRGRLMAETRAHVLACKDVAQSP